MVIPYYKILIYLIINIENIHYNVRSNRTHHPILPNITPATKNKFHFRINIGLFRICGLIGIILTSPNTVPGTKNNSYYLFLYNITYFLQYMEKKHYRLILLNITPATQNNTPKSKRNLPKTNELLFIIYG